MTYYADTSFWLALLFPADRQHATAMRYYEGKEESTWLVSPWAELETLNALRQLSLRNPAPITVAQVDRLRRRWRYYLAIGQFARTKPDWEEVFVEAHAISSAQAGTRVCRGADLLHVALADRLAADVFVTLDTDQATVAREAGMSVEP